MFAAFVAALLQMEVGPMVDINLDDPTVTIEMRLYDEDDFLRACALIKRFACKVSNRHSLHNTMAWFDTGELVDITLKATPV